MADAEVSPQEEYDRALAELRALPAVKKSKDIYSRLNVLDSAVTRIKFDLGFRGIGITHLARTPAEASEPAKPHPPMRTSLTDLLRIGGFGPKKCPTLKQAKDIAAQLGIPSTKVYKAWQDQK